MEGEQRGVLSFDRSGVWILDISLARVLQAIGDVAGLRLVDSRSCRRDQKE